MNNNFEFLRSGVDPAAPNPYQPGTERHARRQREIDAAARAAEFAELTGRTVATSEGITRAAAIARGEIPHFTVPEQPTQHALTADEATKLAKLIIAAAAKARHPT